MELEREVWINQQPFDTLLLKFWSKEQINLLKESLFGLQESNIAEALTPNKKKEEFYRSNVIHEIIHEFHTKTNLCDKFMFCQDVMRHSSGLACVTAAGIRKRLSSNFQNRLGTLNNSEFQRDVMRHSKYTVQRKNLGILIFDCPNDISQLRNHVMKVLFENFYLYTTPLINTTDTGANLETYIKKTVHFILRQIARNTDCLIIFVDQTFSERWNEKSDCIHEILLNSLCWDFKIRLIIISLSPSLDETAMEIFKSYISLKPKVIMYNQLEMAPSGGLVSLIEKSSKLNFKRAFLKYWYRGWEMCTLFGKDDTETELNN